MDTKRFDRLTLALSDTLTRRGLGALLGLGATGMPGLAAAKKNGRKKQRKKIKRNNFNCVNVGDYCKNDGQCCSGICQGKKGKEKCKAHDVGGCQAGQSIGECGGTDVPCTSGSGESGTCFTTTGKAGYCHVSGNCSVCRKDADCREKCGPQAACVLCADCPETGGTGCVGPTEESCPSVMEV
jgi:hypothetical protein